MKRTMIIAVSLVFIVMGTISVAGADMLSNTMFTAQEKAYLMKVDQGHDFTPVKTQTEKPARMYANTMFSGAEQDYLQAVTNGVDFTPLKTRTQKPAKAYVNTMFSSDDLSRLKDINIW